MDAELWIGLAVALIGSTASGSFLTAWVQRRKRDAETEKYGADTIAVLSQTATTLVQPLQDRIERLSNDLAVANDQISKLTESLHAANGRIIELEHQVDLMANRLTQANQSLQERGLRPF